ncbi:hypothetical protein IscW_ISCW001966 [Ixodes scapularis]|uniref:Uncharacterized protein n=1 Tax=Ixodes scapularis TaxID=6945 RepID=B7P849_IXOSC|nr:hypothetical protein IscW_ISCW001966 [Ixodes scapularis]|eukprot:XP_002401065.1 hypothetical protein IscW_ISCW001966 [Ixodes scapularis]
MKQEDGGDLAAESSASVLAEERVKSRAASSGRTSAFTPVPVAAEKSCSPVETAAPAAAVMGTQLFRPFLPAMFPALEPALFCRSLTDFALNPAALPMFCELIVRTVLPLASV